MNYFSGTFPNEEKSGWEENCPGCGAEFLSYQGGAQCQLSKCKFKQLEEEHKGIVQKIADYLLPGWGAKVEICYDWRQEKERKLGFSVPLATPPRIYLGWYTLRMKKHFFNAIVHEIVHISAERLKFDASTQETVRQFLQLIQKGDKLQAEEFMNRKKEIFDRYRKIAKSEYGGHWKTEWYSEYERLYKELMKSSYSIYNYYNLPPHPYKKAITSLPF